jgi:hypothetical protein
VADDNDRRVESPLVGMANLLRSAPEGIEALRRRWQQAVPPRPSKAFGQVLSKQRRAIKLAAQLSHRSEVSAPTAEVQPLPVSPAKKPPPQARRDIFAAPEVRPLRVGGLRHPSERALYGILRAMRIILRG